MSRKIHLRRNKANAVHGDVAACATNPNVAKASRNGRSSYQFMASEILPWDQFRVTEPSKLCAHCIEAALVIRNRQRAAKGMTPLVSWND